VVVLAPCKQARYGDGMKIGEVAVCGTCLRTRFSRAEVAAKRCPCGGRILAMPKGEVEKRRSDRR
jgi:DNA-directed RNA polymerase subunit RPC12/RpoP